MEATAYEEATESGELVEEPQVPEQALSPAERTSDYVQKLTQVCLEDIPHIVEPPEHLRKVSEYLKIPKVDIKACLATCWQSVQKQIKHVSKDGRNIQ